MQHSLIRTLKYTEPQTAWVGISDVKSSSINCENVDTNARGRTLESAVTGSDGTDFDWSWL